MLNKLKILNDEVFPISDSKAVIKLNNKYAFYSKDENSVKYDWNEMTSICGCTLLNNESEDLFIDNMGNVVLTGSIEDNEYKVAEVIESCFTKEGLESGYTSRGSYGLRMYIRTDTSDMFNQLCISVDRRRFYILYDKQWNKLTSFKDGYNGMYARKHVKDTTVLIYIDKNDRYNKLTYKLVSKDFETLYESESQILIVKGSKNLMHDDSNILKIENGKVVETLKISDIDKLGECIGQSPDTDYIGKDTFAISSKSKYHSSGYTQLKNTIIANMNGQVMFKGVDYTYETGNDVAFISSEKKFGSSVGILFKSKMNIIQADNVDCIEKCYCADAERIVYKDGTFKFIVDGNIQNNIFSKWTCVEKLKHSRILKEVYAVMDEKFIWHLADKNGEILTKDTFKDHLDAQKWYSSIINRDALTSKVKRMLILVV